MSMSDEINKPDRQYCRGSNTIFRKLPNNGAECVITFADESLLASVLFHLNGEYHESQMFIRESLDLLRKELEVKGKELAVANNEIERLKKLYFGDAEQC